MYKATVNDKLQFEVERKGDVLLINGKELSADVYQVTPSALHVLNNYASYNAEIVIFDATAKRADIKVNNSVYTVSVKDNFDFLLEKMGLSSANATVVSEIKAPMPGLVLKVFVEEGAEIKKGENLFVLEAMKMENIIKSPADVTIKKIAIAAGQKVEKGQVLISF